MLLLLLLNMMVAVKRLLSVATAIGSDQRSGNIEGGRKHERVASVRRTTGRGDVVYVAATNTTTTNDHLCVAPGSVRLILAWILSKIVE